MLLPVRCRQCGFAFKVHARFAGKVGSCPNCAKKYLVPAADKAPQALPSLPRRRSKSSRSSASRTWVGFSAAAAILLLVCLSLLLGSRGGTTTAAATPTAAVPGIILAAEVAPAAAAKPDTFQEQVLPFLKTHCFDCHSDGSEEAGIGFHKYADTKAVLADRKTWDRVLQMVSSGAMPPGDYDPLPSQAERDKIAAWIDGTLYPVDCDLAPDPGRVTVRRLNRTEYNNTIRDLVGVDFKPAADFPSDDVGYGFDNIGDVLSLPPLLMEKYLDAAEQITSRAILADIAEATVQRRQGKDLKGRGEPDEDGFVNINSEGEVFVEFDFPHDGEYVLRVEAAAEQAGDEPARVELRLDDKRIETFDTDGHRKPKTFEVRHDVRKGKHKLSAAFINDFYNPEAKERRRRDRNLLVRRLEIQGPAEVRPDQLPETHRRIVVATPGKNKTVRQAAEDVLRPFLSRAYRRPARDDEVYDLAGLVEMVVADGETYERGIQIAVQAALVSPQFLFRIEATPNPNDPSKIHALDDYELASRLSYFLWASMPDEELFRLAGEGKLHEPDVLVAQARRMLADPKSQSLVDNFAVQWLNLRNLDDFSPDPRRFRRSFNPRLREDMKRETLMLFETVMREDRSIFDFLTADFTFVNERLADHYDFDGVEGDDFRKVTLPEGQRRGLLTHASILTLTSNPTRTSPVKRGKWIMENILGTPPPPAPPNVPQLEESEDKVPELATLRQQLEAHRADPACASCHKTMDAIGFGLENFDVIGRWRDRDRSSPIDATATLPSGETFNGPIELVDVLKTRQDQFRKCLTEKMLTYALGRGLEYYDRCAVDDITARLAANGDRFSELVVGIVMSDPFLKKRGEKVEDN